jgi:hypothetical protein
LIFAFFFGPTVPRAILVACARAILRAQIGSRLSHALPLVTAR